MADANTTLNYTWTLGDIKLQNQGPLSNVIIHATWTVTGTDANNNSGTHTGSIPLPAPEANTFVQFTSLTQNNVIGWIQSEVQNNVPYWAHIHEMIIDQINKIENPVISINNPWAPVANTPAANT